MIIQLWDLKPKIELVIWSIIVNPSFAIVASKAWPYLEDNTWNAPDVGMLSKLVVKVPPLGNDYWRSR